MSLFPRKPHPEAQWDVANLRWILPPAAAARHKERLDKALDRRKPYFWLGREAETA